MQVDTARLPGTQGHTTPCSTGGGICRGGVVLGRGGVGLWRCRKRMCRVGKWREEEVYGVV